MIDKIVDELDKKRIQDYEVAKKISLDNISLTTDLDNLTVYIPEENEYDQYSIDSFLRSMNPLIRTYTKLDKDIYVMKVFRPITVSQYVKLVDEIIDLNDFCTIINKE